MEGWKEAPLHEPFRSLKVYAGYVLPGPESPILKFLLLARQLSPGWLTLQPPSLFFPSQTGKELWKWFPGYVTVDQLSQLPLGTHSRVNYPLWKSHLSSNLWAWSPFRLVPFPFWTLLLLIGCDVHLPCMPQNIVPCSLLPGLPYLFPFLLFLGLRESLWT